MRQQRARQAGPDRPGPGAHRRRHLRRLRVVRGAHRQDAGDGIPACHTVHDMQAARGTSLSSSDAEPDRHPAVPSRRAGPRRSSSVVALRRTPSTSATKWLGRRPAHRRAGHRGARRPGSVLHLTRNPGAAFSTGTELHRAVHLRSRSPRCCVVLWLSRRVGNAVLGGRARPAARRHRRQPHRPDVPRPRAAARARRRLPACCRTGRSSTSPTSASTSRPALILVQAFRGVRLDGSRSRAVPTSACRTRDAPRHERRPPGPAGARGAGRRARRRRAWPGCSGSRAPAPPT